MANTPLGDGVEWAAAEARRVIHGNDVEGLKRLLAEYPALLSWRGDDDDGGLLAMATGAYGDAGDPDRERWFTRAACAELLIDAGTVVTRSVCEGLIASRARGLLQLFERKGLLPRTLEFSAALGDTGAVRSALDADGNDLTIVNDAFVSACRFGHEAVASLLLERSIALDPELGARVDASVGRPAFVSYFIERRPAHAAAVGPWKAFVMEQVTRAIHDGELAEFVRGLQRDPWLLGDTYAWFQSRLIEEATLNDRGQFIDSLFDLEPALLRCQPPPESHAIEFALTYGNTRLVPLLTRVWPLPDDLPHAAGMGNLTRAMEWFDDGGAAAQQVLDTALAFAVTNGHFDVADFLLERGADINTTWNSHEPASLLHHLVFYGSYESMQYVIDRGIDMTIKDYRWNSTAEGWARYAKKDETLAQWLKDAEVRRRSDGP